MTEETRNELRGLADVTDALAKVAVPAESEPTVEQAARASAFREVSRIVRERIAFTAAQQIGEMILRNQMPPTWQPPSEPV